MIHNELSFLDPGAAAFRGPADDAVAFSLKYQLLDRKTWRDFVEVFRHDSDDENYRWRCEYWGKMMRGACLTYRYCASEELYAILDETVRDLLTTVRPDGRISTYSEEAQLHGWDVWGRKYVTTALLHFYRICKDENLKADILSVLMRHMDALIEKVGDGEDKIPIVKTSDIWGGVNSCSILDAVLDLYQTTGEKRFLDFAEYIISTGGCVDGNLIEIAKEDKIAPYLYPEVKAYETMSFFEGLLTYYQVTEKEEYLDIVLKFYRQVEKTDITVIGCSGTHEEIFNNSIVHQTEYSESIMQETCVTVTWMRLSAKLFLLTGEEKYVAHIERSALNALFGAMNTHMQKQYDYWGDHSLLDPLPFDSYSPLYNQRRGFGVGGFNRFDFGGYYGCCACIASAGTALLPLVAVTKGQNSLTLSALMSGSVSEKFADGEISLTVIADYPKDFGGKIEVNTCKNVSLRIRIPEYAENAVFTLNGYKIEAESENGYLLISDLHDGDVITVRSRISLCANKINDKVCFTHGAIVLARDSKKENGAALDQPVELSALSPVYEEPKDGEMLRLTLPLADGGRLLLTDYASCGKWWLDEHPRISVFTNLK